MTVAEQLAREHPSKLAHFWRAIQFIIAVAVIIMAIVLTNVNHQAASTAKQASSTANHLDSLLTIATKFTCKARATTLRTAPQTVKEIRAVIDAESVQARLVCPKLDYADLDRQRNTEIALLKAGADPANIAQNGIDGADGKAGPAGAQGAVGSDGARGARGSVGAAGQSGINGKDGSNGERGPRGATGAVGPQGPAGPPGPAGPQGKPGISVGIGTH